MIKACEIKWKKSCLIKLATTQMRDDCESLLSHLATLVDSVQPESTKNCNMHVINTIWNESLTMLQTLFPQVAQLCDEEVPNNLGINKNEILSSSKKQKMC